MTLFNEFPDDINPFDFPFESSQSFSNCIEYDYFDPYSPEIL